jgi:MFS family permease
LPSVALAPLRTADYRRLWVGQVVSVIGDKINQIAMAMMVFAITGSMLQMGIMLGVTVLPTALFGLPAGVYVDRWDRRRTMLVADVLRAAVVVAIPFVVRFGIGWAYALAFVTATLALFFVPAKRSLIPDLVPGDDLMAANSLDNASEAIAELIGLAAGAAIVATIGYSGAFAADAATFLVSAAMIAMIRFRQPQLPFPAPREDFAAETLAGVRSIFTNEVLRELFSVYVASALFAAAAIAVCYALALERYRAGAAGLALLDAASAVGILVGSVLVARSGPGRLGMKFLIGVTVFAPVFALLVFAHNIWIAAVLIAAAGVMNMFFFIPATTLFQTLADSSVRGRVMAAVATATRIMMAIGLVLAGALAEKISLSLVIIGVGLVALLVAGIGWTLRALREA